VKYILCFLLILLALVILATGLMVLFQNDTPTERIDNHIGEGNSARIINISVSFTPVNYPVLLSSLTLQSFSTPYTGTTGAFLSIPLRCLPLKMNTPHMRLMMRTMIAKEMMRLPRHAVDPS